MRRPFAFALMLACAIAPSTAAMAEPAVCLSPDPAAWPTGSKPYFLIIADTSSSMTTAIASANACGLPNDRLGHLRCALRSSISAFGGQVNFGLATFAMQQSGCAAGCYSGCTTTSLVGNVGAAGCGAMPGGAASRAGAYIRVPMLQDAFWMLPPTATNVPSLLQWVDGDCAASTELFAGGSIPLNGALRDAQRYFLSGWTAPGGAPTYPSPLDANDRTGTGVNGSTGCRSVNVILVTSGDESCDSQADAVAAAASLYTNGVSVGGKTYKVRVHVVNLGGATPASMDAIAVAGGSGTSIVATDAAQMASAFSTIIGHVITPETCDNVDNNCNGCTDEGFAHYCNVAQTCCSWSTTAQRNACMATYNGTITPVNPRGDTTKLPCATSMQQADPTAWVCVDPRERCDNVDNNCSGGADENVTKCGSPLHCPSTEVCDGSDNDCDGAIDENGVCGSCVVSPEVCDGCDNDCDGVVDDSIPAVACGAATPANCIGLRGCIPGAFSVTPGACLVGGGTSICTNSPQTELCDGIDNDCDGVVDDAIATTSCVPAGTPGGLIYGPPSQCVQGQRACGGACTNFVGPSPEICDGIDNDCDGQIDESAIGVAQPCGSNQAPCTSGMTACVNGALVCQGSSSPGVEVCDGTDNDCDGQVDEPPLADAPPPGQHGCWNLPGNCCTRGSLAWCPPPGATCDGAGTLTAPCDSGTLVCAGAAGWSCEGGAAPSAEACNGRDDDCNGQVDDGSLPSPVGTPCGTAGGACTSGVNVCTNGAVVCNGNLPSLETCNGIDDDCDGTPDDGLPSSGTCMAAYDTVAYPGVRTMGVCRAGTFACVASADACVGAVGPSPELCNGLDDDCDGQVDEAGASPDGIDGSASPVDGSRVVGAACQTDPLATDCAPGTFVCTSGTVRCDMNAPIRERCDGLDNDCDGATDETDVSAPVCLTGKACVETGASVVFCSPPCGATPCPSGQRCEDVVSSETGAALPQHCVPYDDRPADVGVDASTPIDAGPQQDAGSNVDAGGVGSLGGGGGCGCHVAGVPSETPTLLPIALVLGLIVAGRRRRFATKTLHVVALVAAIAGGCDCGGSPHGTDASVDANTTLDATTADATTCVPTLGGIEVCDGIDEDCNGVVDDVDVSDVRSCGGCANNCLIEVDNCVPSAIGCSAGACTCATCALGYVDANADGASCEVQLECTATSGADATCDGVDDDCDGTADDDVDRCATSACGGCGIACDLPHASSACGSPGSGTCNPSTAICLVDACQCTGAGSCFFDVDGAPANGCEYACDLTNGGVEICDGLDNDCDGRTDALDDLSADATIGASCFGDPDGACADAAHAGATECVNGVAVCAGAAVLRENQAAESCNSVDDDCDGSVDESAAGVGASCGASNIAPCAFGSMQCQGGSLTCVGAKNPATEVCNGRDDDCDGMTDSTGGTPPLDAMGACNVPTPPPSGATSPCSAGTLACTGGAIVCQGGTGPSGAVDACGVDSNCDGTLTNQPVFASDPSHCGNCATNCYAGALHANWACAGSCQFLGCQAGYYDLNNDQKCEYACVFASATESCNGVDDDCDGQIDEGAVVPSPASVCGVSVLALRPECTSGVSVACVNGAFQCSFPPGVCSGAGCDPTDEQCDALDNDCDGYVNENVLGYGMPCSSDDGLPTSHGACRTTGTYACNGPLAVQCSATKADCASLPGGCTELCDGADNDCDGLVDEPRASPGPNNTNYVRPAVTNIAAARWIMTYEASRPNATTTTSGTGNGYFTAAPVGSTLDQTRACSVPSRLPWTNVTPAEAEQTCTALGGFVCATSDWQTACASKTGTCSYGYSPADTACTSDYVFGSKFCNMGPSFDSSAALPGDQDALLLTASASLLGCAADWTTGQTNGLVYDITGNAREITRNAANDYRLMGGSYATTDTAGSTCGASSYAVDASFRYEDAGFRCCFATDPSL